MKAENDGSPRDPPLPYLKRIGRCAVVSDGRVVALTAAAEPCQ